MEEWKSVVGWSDCYEVSSLGRIRRSAPGHSTFSGRVLALHPDNWGYLRVTLCRDGRPKKFFVHMLVAEAFIGPRPDSMFINHKNGTKTDNTAVNLEYVTCSENIQHSYRSLGRKAYVRFGEANSSAKLSYEKADEIRRLYTSGDGTQAQLASRFGVSQPAIGQIIRGKTWVRTGSPR